MKLTTTILILFVCFGCKVKEKEGGTVTSVTIRRGTVDTSGYGQKDDTITGAATTIYSEHYTPRFETARQYDTQKVIMLVCDTSHAYIDLIGMDYKIIYKELNTRKSYWQYGYEVRDRKEVANERNITIDTHGNVVPDIVYETAGYLDADKKPLSKSIIVWQTKELK